MIRTGFVAEREGTMRTRSGASGMGSWELRAGLHNLSRSQVPFEFAVSVRLRHVDP